jgi:hypothetical protein
MALRVVADHGVQTADTRTERGHANGDHDVHRPHTSLSPSAVMAVITDFGPDRARWWPNVDEAHIKRHDQGPDWAEVTEGTGMGWEREHYSWDVTAGTVTIDTLDSNLWGPAVVGGTSSCRLRRAPTFASRSPGCRTRSTGDWSLR